MNTQMTMAAPLVLAALLLVACGKEPATAPPAAAQPPPAPVADTATPAADTPATATPAMTTPGTGTRETGAPAGTDGGGTDSAPTAAAPASPAPTTTKQASATQAIATTATTTAPAAAKSPTTVAAAAKTATAPVTTGTTTTSTATKPAASGATRDPGTLTRAEPLRAKPFADAAEVATLAAGTAVNIDARDGGWYQVSSGGKTGWVRMLSVRRSTAAGTSVEGLASVASGRAGTGSVVSTTGIRGLDSQALAAATFNEERIAKAESFRTSRQDADAFARQGGLTVRDVPALPAPKK